MQRLEVIGAVRPMYGSLGVKRLTEIITFFLITIIYWIPRYFAQQSTNIFLEENHVLSFKVIHFAAVSSCLVESATPRGRWTCLFPHATPLLI